MATVSEMNISALKVAQLKEELEKLNLPIYGKKATLRKRLRGALFPVDDVTRGGEEEAANKDADEEESEDDDEQEENDENDVNNDDAKSKIDRSCGSSWQPLTFKDVEDSLQTFSGDGKQNIRRWLEEFEETSEVCGWTEAQKIVYAKKLLRGSAKLYVSYEKCSNTWRRLKKSLIEEFAKTVNSRQVHRELAQTKKKYDESYHEYVYRMMEIASHADIELEAKIQYIIEGIHDETVNKTILYGARNIKELRIRLTQYEAMKNSMNQRPKQQGGKFGKEMIKGVARATDSKTTEIKRCFNCGGKNHYGVNCPLKEKGAKCFQCGEFGHIAAKCDKKSDKRVNECTSIRDGKVYKTVIIGAKRINALVDTGSDLHLMRAEQYIRLGAPTLTGSEIVCKGLGSDNIVTIGSFETSVTIDENMFRLIIHVVSDAYLNYDLLLGSNLLKYAEMRINASNVEIIKQDREKIDCVSDDVPEIFCINTSELLKDDVIECKPRISIDNIENVKVKRELEEIVNNYKPCGIKETGIKMNIVLKDEIPIYERPRRLAPVEREQVNQQISEWLKNGIVRPSTSEYASPVVLVKKKDGKIRLCVDYRKLNKKVIKDRQPLPLIEDQLDLLQGAEIFSVLDLKDGFFHVALNDDSCKYTAFIVPDGHFEFLKVPFGLCNSPAIFQKYIQAVFRELAARNIVLMYLDDIIIPARTMKEGISNLKTVLSTASDYGLKINWAKCNFLQRQIEYLGYRISNGCVRPSERKIHAVVNFPVPTCARQVQSFLGLSGYFRKFVPYYSSIARPLSDLLKNSVTFHFDEEQMYAFKKLKEILSHEPVLKLYRPTAETELHTDASSQGLGAILLQRDSEDQMFHPVYYASWKTTDAESRYTSYELEVLAIIKSLNKFRVYLLGIPFKVITDCRAFALTLNKKDLCTRVARWALLLSEFDHTIEHRPGSAMRHVDALSRNPATTMLVEEDNVSFLTRLSRAQSDDDDLKSIFEIMNSKTSSDYVLQHGILYRKCDDDLLIVIPRAMQRDIIKFAHDKGHFSAKKIEQILRKEYWFSRMREKIEKIIKNCIPCILSERKQGKQEGFLRPIPKGDSPLETYHLDYLGPIPSTKKKYVHILLVVDAFTKYTWLYPTKSTTSEETIARLVKQSAIFGNPRQIITDRGTAFTSRIFQQYCIDHNIQHVLITTGVPRSNGQVERMNRIIIPILSKLSSPKSETWYQYVDQVQQYINSTPTRSTGMSPFELLIGRKMRLKDDLELKRLIEIESNQLLQEKREEMRERAKDSISKIQRENKQTYDKKRKKATTYKEGDLVAIKRTQIAPGSKFATKYLGPYQVSKVLRSDRYMVTKLGEHEGPRSTTASADHMKWWVPLSDDSDDDDVNLCEIDDNSEHRGPMFGQNGRVVESCEN